MYIFAANFITNYGEVKAIKYTLGEDINCKKISSCTNKTIYCNGPLKSNTWYHVGMRAFSRGGYSTTFLIKTSKCLLVHIFINLFIIFYLITIISKTINH